MHHITQTLSDHPTTRALRMAAAVATFFCLTDFALCQSIQTENGPLDISDNSAQQKALSVVKKTTEAATLLPEFLALLELRKSTERCDEPEEETIAALDTTSSWSRGGEAVKGETSRRKRVRFTDLSTGTTRTIVRSESGGDQQTTCPKPASPTVGFRFSTKKIQNQIKNADPNTFHIDPPNFRALGLEAGPCSIRLGTAKTYAGAVFRVRQPGQSAGCGGLKMTASWWKGGLRGWYVTELPKNSTGTLRVTFNYLLQNFAPETKGTIPSIEPVFYSRRGPLTAANQGFLEADRPCAARLIPFTEDFPIPEDSTHFVIKPGFSGKDTGSLIVWNLKLELNGSPIKENAPTTGVPEGDESSLSGDLRQENEVIRLTNLARQKEGLPELAYSPDLTRSSRYHANDMRADDYFTHDSQDRQDGKLVFVCDTFTRIAQFDPAPSAENIAKGQETAQEVVEGWLNSPGHRANIMSPTSSRLGVGKVGGYWVQNFGR